MWYHWISCLLHHWLRHKKDHILDVIRSNWATPCDFVWVIQPCWSLSSFCWPLLQWKSYEWGIRSIANFFLILRGFWRSLTFSWPTDIDTCLIASLFLKSSDQLKTLRFERVLIKKEPEGRSLPAQGTSCLEDKLASTVAKSLEYRWASRNYQPVTNR